MTDRSATATTYQVEYTSRPDEREHIVPVPSLRKACDIARQMSDRHDGIAIVVAMDTLPDMDGDSVLQSVGHVEYVFGIRQPPVGRLQ